MKTSLSLEIVIGVATIPVLVGLVSAKAISQGIIELGRASEEVFRGDRLPLLYLSNTLDPNRES